MRNLALLFPWATWQWAANYTIGRRYENDPYHLMCKCSSTKTPLTYHISMNFSFSNQCWTSVPNPFPSPLICHLRPSWALIRIYTECYTSLLSYCSHLINISTYILSYMGFIWWFFSICFNLSDDNYRKFLPTMNLRSR